MSNWFSRCCKNVQNKLWKNVYQNVIINLLLFIYHIHISYIDSKWYTENRCKVFATGIHQSNRHERFTKSIKCSLLNINDRFPPQSFEC